MLALAIICAALLWVGAVVDIRRLRRLRARRRADIAAQAWGDGACGQRPEDYNSGPPRPVPPETGT